jgi:hypothetical protein
LVEERHVRERGRGAPDRRWSRRAGGEGRRSERDARRRLPLDPGAVGAHPSPEDRDLPGRPLWALADEAVESRTAFSEYHAIFSPSGIFMVRTARYKYVHYVGYPPQLFDLVADPEETRDLAADPAHADARATCERELRAICDPEAVDRRARADQRRRLEAAGGASAILAEGVKIPYTPAPAEFEPARSEARERPASLPATPGVE